MKKFKELFETGLEFIMLFITAMLVAFILFI